MNLPRIANLAYWAVFVTVFLLAAIGESRKPVTALKMPAERRWTVHGILFIISVALTGLILRTTPVLLAISVAGREHALLNRAWIPPAAQWLIAILVLDFARYAAHRMMHRVNFLWRVHEIHHSDRDYDVSTAVRFHPIEVLLTEGVTLGVIWLLAPPPASVLAAVLLSIAENVLAHANISLPARMEAIVRRLLITPDSHRLHHSCDNRDYNRNFGQTFPWWDQLFGTWAVKPAGSAIQTGVPAIGIAETSSGLPHLLLEPFRSRPDVAGSEAATSIATGRK